VPGRGQEHHADRRYPTRAGAARRGRADALSLRVARGRRGARVLPLAGAARAFCCAGCEAAALAITGAGLDAYYRLRAQATGRPASPARDRGELAGYDDPSFQASFVVTDASGCREAALLLEGIRCAACVWLNEQVIGRLPGVAGVSINYATRRAQVRWGSCARSRWSSTGTCARRRPGRAIPG
jgi:hypothetical protein